jgi:8-oxo-dGTP diphosphatase
MNNQKLPFALIAIDLCIFKIVEGELCVFVRDVNKESLYQGFKCIPGGLIMLEESAEETMKRIVREKTPFDFKDMYVEQLYTFSKVNRDKRSRVVSCAYFALYNGNVNDGFIPVRNIKKLAYDHNEIIALGVERLQNKLDYTTVVKKLLHTTFTYSELQKAYELILCKEIDKRNFRKKFDSLKVLVDTKQKRKEGRMRPATVYRFKSKDIETLKIFD